MVLHIVFQLLMVVSSKLKSKELTLPEDMQPNILQNFSFSGLFIFQQHFWHDYRGYAFNSTADFETVREIKEKAAQHYSCNTSLLGYPESSFLSNA